VPWGSELLSPDQALAINEGVGDHPDPGLVEGVEDVVFAGRALSCCAPGSAGEIHTGLPAGSAMTCTFTPWALCFPE
jgi:hypothetical protein